MVQSVEVLLDGSLEDRIRECWTALLDAGLPSAGRNPAPSNRPHITLAVAPDLTADREQAIAAAAAGLPIDLLLGGILLFGRRREFVMAQLVVPSDALLELHRAVYAAMADDRLGHQQPGAWTPHVTLCRRLKPAALPQAVAIVARHGEQAGRGVAVRRWDGTAKRDWVIAGDPGSISRSGPTGSDGRRASPTESTPPEG